jgi:hypothetical protein
MATHRVRESDLERWVSGGLITSEQRAAIERDLADREEQEPRLTLATLLYYVGGLLVLVAYSVFLGFQWGDLAAGGRIAIAALSFAFFATGSYVLLQSGRYRIPGELLQVVAVAIVPLLTFAVLDALGWWPEDPGYPGGDVYRTVREAYQGDLAWARMALGGATLVAALVAFYISRSQFVLVAGVLAVGSIFLDVTIAVEPSADYTWHIGQALMVAALGTLVLVVGIAVRDRGERDYTTWLYITGLAGMAAGLAPLTFPDNAANAWGAVWMGAALAVLALSLPLQQRLFVAAGLLAVLVYLGKLVFDVFDSDATAALALVVLGVLVLGAGMLYQRITERAFATTPRA